PTRLSRSTRSSPTRSSRMLWMSRWPMRPPKGPTPTSRLMRPPKEPMPTSRPMTRRKRPT
ncbi:uncharacterized protein METZ01_LOCUS32937, partial [marine metagenome]